MEELPSAIDQSVKDIAAIQVSGQFLILWLRRFSKGELSPSLGALKSTILHEISLDSGLLSFLMRSPRPLWTGCSQKSLTLS